jgi:hypothetical protein
MVFNGLHQKKIQEYHKNLKNVHRKRKNGLYWLIVSCNAMKCLSFPHNDERIDVPLLTLLVDGVEEVDEFIHELFDM